MREYVIEEGIAVFPPEAGIVCKEKGARQADAASCDINNIVKQYDRTGMLPQTTVEGMFADVSGLKDYQSALEQLRIGEEYFYALPVATRGRFANSVAAFLDFAMDPKNKDEVLVMFGAEAPKVVAAAPAADVAVKP